MAGLKKCTKSTQQYIRDGFDTLIDHAPEKLHFVKQVTHLILPRFHSKNTIPFSKLVINLSCIFFALQSLVKFANVHLSSLGWPVTSLERDFSDGVRLILLTGCLEVILFFSRLVVIAWNGMVFNFSFYNFLTLEMIFY